MTDLSDLFNKLGFIDAETYIQSGNVIFSHTDDLDMNDIRTKIETAILERFNYNIPVIIRSIKEMKELMLINPFLNEPDFDPSKMAIIFLHTEPLETQVQKVRNIDYPPDKFKIYGREIYIYCPSGFGRTKLYTNFFENKMSVIGTARNWKTINKLLEMAEKKNQE
jgi:uncharacterized protein (DUF1697 family)